MCSETEMYLLECTSLDRKICHNKTRQQTNSIKLFYQITASKCKSTHPHKHTHSHPQMQTN